MAPPKGGPKDTDPPKVVRAIPENGTVNFTGNGFILEFDEFIQTQGLQQELIISPPLEKKPDVLVDGKELRVEWEEELKANETYSFRFGSSVQDITESNQTQDLVYVLSTGDRLDSLHFEGRIVDARSMEGVEGVLAMLYKDMEDSVPRTRRPFYFSRSDANGHFDIPYLADGEYKFFALEDKNRNQRFDLPNERIAFLDEAVRPYEADSTGKELVRLFEEEGEKQYIEERRIEPGHAFLDLKKRADRVELSTLEENPLSWDRIKDHPAGVDSLEFWFVDPEMPDSLELAVRVDGETLDTIQVRNARSVDEKGFFGMTPLFDDPLDLHEEAGFLADAPLAGLNEERITSVSDSDTVALAWRIGGVAERQLFFEREGMGEMNKIHFLPGALRDTFGRSNDSVSFSFSLQDPDQYGALSLLSEHAEGKKEPFLLRLLKEGESVRARKGRTGERMEFEHLDPGEHRLELILDRDSNGRWTTGAYPERQPEPVFYYPDTVKVRSSWTQEIEWKGIGEP